MEQSIKEWQVVNVSQGGLPIPLSSISQAVEVLVEISKKDMGETLEFMHSHRGLICCTAGKQRSTITFVPDYDKQAHSLAGKRIVLSENGNGKLFHVDGIGSVSSIPSRYLVSILDAVRALVYILEVHDVPAFLQWSDPVQDL
jgi:hypothetical protein